MYMSLFVLRIFISVKPWKISRYKFNVVFVQCLVTVVSHYNQITIQFLISIKMRQTF